MDTKQNLAAGVIDPVCGMTVNPATASHKIGHDGKDFYFCCRACAEKFSANPALYLNKAAKSSLGLVTLGMPGNAPAEIKVKDPVCGMDVDPITAQYKLDHAGRP